MMRLYQFPGGDGLTSLSAPCIKVEMALKRIGAPYEVVLFRSTFEARRTSPSGRVPMLEVDGARITDSVTILDELEARFPSSDLFPGDPQERLRDRLWDHFATDHIYWLGFARRWVLPESRERFVQAVFGRAPLPTRLAVRWLALPSIARRGKGQGAGLKSPEEIDRGLERAFDMLVTGLDGGPFLQGRGVPGRGDLATASLAAQLGFRDTMPDTLAAFRQRAGLVEHVQRVYDAVGMDRPRWLR